MNKKGNVKIFKLILLIMVLLISIGIIFYLFPVMKNLSTIEGQVAFKEKVDNSGVIGLLLLFGLQVAQIFLIIVPGEPIEILSGMCYGGLWGTVFIMVSASIISIAIYFLVRKLGMKSATVEKRVAKHLNLNESKKLLSTALNSDQRYKIRNYTITCLFLNCCLRLSKLIQIDLTDLKLDERTLKVHGKGNMERIVYLNDAVLEALTEYLKVRPSLGKDNIDYNALFISSRNKRISKRAVQSIIKEELNMTFDEAKDGLHTHTLRHTGATLMYNENDTNILVLKKVLGHKSIAATEVYTHVDPKKLKDIMENCAISSLLERKEEVMANGRN